MDLYKPDRETEVQVDAKDVSVLWDRLKKLTPIETGGSFHVSDTKYLLDERTYVCFWFLTGKSTSDVPDEIFEIIKLSKDQIKYPRGFQMDLFYDQ